MSISRLVKILVVVFVVLAGFNVTFAMLTNRAHEQKEYAMEQRIELAHAVHNFQTASADLTRWARAYAVTGDIREFNAFMNEIDNVQRRENAAAIFESLNAPDSELALIQRAFDLDEALAELDDLAFDAVKAGDRNLAIQIIYGPEYEAAISPIIATLEQLSREVEARTQQEADAAYASASLFETLTLVVTVLFALLSIGSILIVLRKISPIQNLLHMVGDVSEGKLNVNVDRSKLSKDEIGELTQDIHNLVDVIKYIMDDLETLYHEYCNAGNMRYQIDESKYDNSFKEVIGLVNKLISRNTEDLYYLKNQMALISNGDFSIHMDDTAWPGDWKTMPETVNQLAANLNGVSKEISVMIEAVAGKGDLSFKIPVDNYQGDWKKIMTGLNDVISAADAPIAVVEICLNEMQKGNFDINEMDRIIATKSLDPNATSYNGVFRNLISAVDVTVKEVSSCIAEISRDLKEIAGGNLTVKLTREFVGDFIAIKESLNEISSTFRKTISEINTASEQVLLGAQQISISAQELSNGAQEQASSVQELNAAIDVINQQTRQNADDAIEASKISEKSTVNAQQGNDSMKEMVTAMSQIKESSGEISKIIGAIQDIAFQTNLLALNASVEAARAGEHGKGFSVVAEEVRSLAGRSQNSATETTGLIETSNSRVESGSNIASATSQSLDMIVKNASEVSTLIGNISVASKEQAESIAQISEGLMQISKVTQSNSAVSEETAAASEELNSQAELLQHLVSYFRL